MDQYIGFDCPNCEAYCVYSNGDISDLTVEDVSHVRCWNCRRVSAVPEFDGEDFTLIAQYDEDGVWAADSTSRPI